MFSARVADDCVATQGIHRDGAILVDSSNACRGKSTSAGLRGGVPSGPAERSCGRLLLVHFYHEVDEEELYGICKEQLGDVEKILAAFMTWLDRHPEKLDRTV